MNSIVFIVFLIGMSLASINIPREVYVKANSFYDAGFQFGRQSKDFVQARFADDKNLNTKLLPFYHTQKGHIVYDHFFSINKARFPEYMEELRGQADGAGVPFENVFLSTLNEEFSDYVDTKYKYYPVESCSDVIVNEVGIAHNEDGSLIDFNRTTFLHQTISINGHVVSSFHSWCYAGQLPTAGNYLYYLFIKAFGFNSHIAMSMNYLHTKIGDYNGIARNFIARYISCYSISLDDAWNRITSTPHCVGHNYQVMDLVDGRVVDIEIAPFDRVLNITCNLVKVGRFTALPEHPHFHSNMFSLIMVDDTPSASSIHREARYKEMTPPRSFREALLVLSDEKDKVEPIYRKSTLNTALYDFYRRKCIVYIGPASNDDVIAEYDF